MIQMKSRRERLFRECEKLAAELKITLVEAARRVGNSETDNERKALLEMARVVELEKENGELRAENERLRKANGL